MNTHLAVSVDPESGSGLAGWLSFEIFRSVVAKTLRRAAGTRKLAAVLP